MTETMGGRPVPLTAGDIHLTPDERRKYERRPGGLDQARTDIAESLNMERLGNWAGAKENARMSRWPGGGGAGGGSAEFEDLATLRRFAEQVCALGEGSDFVQTIHACSGLQDMVRDFGGDMNTAAAALVDAAVAVARDGEALREQATQVAALAQDMSGA